MEIVLSLLLMTLFGIIGYFIAKKTNLNPIVWFFICFIFVFYGVLAELSWLILLKILNILKTNNPQNPNTLTQQHAYVHTSQTGEKRTSSPLMILGWGCLLILSIFAIAVLLFVIGFDYLAFTVGSELKKTSDNINKFVE